MFLVVANKSMIGLQRPRGGHKVIWYILIQDSDNKNSSGTAASKQSREARTLHSEQSEVVAKVDYEDDKLLAELAKMDDYYYEWRRDHPNQPIIDGSPMFINQSYCNTNLMRNHTA